MKLLNFTSILIAAILMVACSSGDDNPIDTDIPDLPNKPNTPEITIPEGQEDFFAKDMIFENKGGEKTITFYCTVDWTIAVAETKDKAQWFSICPTSGKAGKCSVKVKTEGNPTYDERAQTLTLKAGSLKKDVKIVQKQKDTLFIRQKEFNIKAEEVVIRVKLTHNIDYSIQIKDNWITQISTRGMAENLLSFTIKANENTTKRSGRIIISDKDNTLSETILVNQYGKSNDNDEDTGGKVPDFPWD